jgi:glycerol uptake facilitator-like aquaporin
MYNLPQRLSAEFLGTFALVFFGAGAICADNFLHGAGGTNLFLIAAAQGLIIAVMYSALAHISGGHFNPAITIGFWVTKRSSTVEVALYSLARSSPHSCSKPSSPKTPGAPPPWALPS